MTYHRRLKKTVFKKYSGYDWTCDAMYQEPRVKDADKRMRSKHERTIRKRIDRKEVREYE
ncbi:hypothetical protein ACWGRE_07385 [Bacillus velezensis]|uniref:hypothetical protein n=1 Tax=Bacillus amyloliquefaciens group TaxID=1938374 RepID=UPI000B604E5F|nr:hypothetical protein [Bacillus velezensis]ASB64750.1 hypothetical protein S101413_01303 [Bacillus velezensis]QAV91829.1 hypothetical protein ES966_06300 [Bacillus velezensis]QAW23944.1 hypothetical protein ETA12_04690 [Bacillus velezensis]QAW49412.1 hypothetical protein ETK69_06675 [Bacillus velezensis]TWO89715.1 hypothetical protein EUA42_14220 [Bacillus velezensis]